MAVRFILKNCIGPMYGLRMLVYVNESEYMPTTEATGIRLAIHDKEDYPFPDTFGYSAPTGYVSSFGLRLIIYVQINVFKKILRMKYYQSLEIIFRNG